MRRIMIRQGVCLCPFRRRVPGRVRGVVRGPGVSPAERAHRLMAVAVDLADPDAFLDGPPHEAIDRERPQVFHFIGFALVLTGVFAASRKPSAATE